MKHSWHALAWGDLAGIPPRKLSPSEIDSEATLTENYEAKLIMMGGWSPNPLSGSAADFKFW